MAAVILKKGRVQPVWAGHPWVFAQAVESVEGNPAPGDEVQVRDTQGKHLGRGLYSPQSAIRVRMYTRGDEAFDERLVALRLERALAYRERLGLPNAETTGYRLTHGESDELPGLVVDRFADKLVVQLGTVGLAARRDWLGPLLLGLPGITAVQERTPNALKRLEGMAESAASWGRSEGGLSFSELGFKYDLPADLGQKTGFYFDLRDLRQRVEHWAKGARVLDCYSYLGSFSLAAARGGATSVDACESSQTLVDLAGVVAKANGFADIRHHKADARQFLAAVEAHSYDFIVLDPPKLAHSKKEIEKAQRVYQALLATAFSKVSSGGLVLVCSCSHAIGLPELERAAALATREANCRTSILERAFQSPDHRTLPAFPEGLYLTALLLQVEH
jgi:23S rRNA (cytosine1962-C5)-methyltransferase